MTNDYTSLTPPVAMQMVMDGCDKVEFDRHNLGGINWLELTNGDMVCIGETKYRIKTTDLEEWDNSQIKDRCPKCKGLWKYDTLTPMTWRKCTECGFKQKADYTGDILGGITWIDTQAHKIKSDCNKIGQSIEQAHKDAANSNLVFKNKCPTCNGSGKRFKGDNLEYEHICAICNGTGKNNKAIDDYIDCPKCGGTGKDGHDRSDPPDYYECGECNGTGHKDAGESDV